MFVGALHPPPCGRRVARLAHGGGVLVVVNQAALSTFRRGHGI